MEQKKQFPLDLNSDNSVGTVNEIQENLSFRTLQRQSLPKSRVSGLLIQDNNTVFATSKNSFDAMDLTKCIDNRQSMARGSTRFSMGMDLTECIDNRQHTTTNCTRFSVGMDLTEGVIDPQNATSNATRFSLGMDMTNLVGKSLNTISLPSEEAIYEPYTDKRAQHFAPCSNLSDAGSLDDSNALELTDAIDDPRFSAKSMLYSVSNTGLNKHSQQSVPDKTRYSLSGMDLTKAAISNCSSVRRKSTRYSLCNMDLTEVVNDGDCSGLDFTEVINDPKIVAMSTRYSINDMDLTEGLINKDHTKFPVHSLGSAVEEDKLDYSASSETSMDFTKPIHNILQSHEQNDTLLNDNIIDSRTIQKEIESKKSTSSSEHERLEAINECKEFNETLSKTNTLVATDFTLHCLENTENKSFQNDIAKLTSESTLLLPVQLNCNNSSFQNTQTVFPDQVVNEKVCTSVTPKPFSPETKHVDKVLNEAVVDSPEMENRESLVEFATNSSYNINLPLSNPVNVESCFEGSVAENHVKLNVISTSGNQERKEIVSETDIGPDEHLETAETSYENMEVSDMDSFQCVHSNFVSNKGSNSDPFSRELALETAAENASKSMLFVMESQQDKVPMINNEIMEISDIANTNDTSNKIPDVSVVELSQPPESDWALDDKENLPSPPDKELIKSSTSKKEHDQPNIYVYNVQNNSLLNENNDGSTNLPFGLENNLNYCLRKELSTSKTKMGKENIDNSLNTSENHQLANGSFKENFMSGLKTTEDDNTLFMNKYDTTDANKKNLEPSHLEDTAAVELSISSDTLANVSTNSTLCAKNVTMTRGGATRHSTVFSTSLSLSEVSNNEDSLMIHHNMEETSILESLPLSQRIALSGDNNQNCSDLGQSKNKTADALGANPHKGKIQF